MQIINSPELVQAIDSYELMLSHYPDVLPITGFNVFQGSICLEGIKNRIVFGTGALLEPYQGEDSGLVSLSKSIGDPEKEAYKIRLLANRPSPVIPRLSSTSFCRRGNAIGIRTFKYDSQGRAVEIKQPTELQNIHVSLASFVLSSAQAKNKIIYTQARRDELEREKRSPQTTVARDKAIDRSLEHTKL